MKKPRRLTTTIPPERGPNPDGIPGLKKGGRPGLWANINKRKKLGISRSKKDSTISKESWDNMKKGFPKKRVKKKTSR